MNNVTIQATTTKILDDVNRMINHTEIMYDDLFEFEKLIFNGEYEEIKTYIEQNENCIYDRNMLCNGFYKKKFKTHPTCCHQMICSKTPVYYGLWLNLYYSNAIFEKIKLLATLSTKDILQDYISFMSKIHCTCHILSTYKNNYDGGDMAFTEIYTFLSSKMNEFYNTYEDYKSHMTRKNTHIKSFKINCDHMNIVKKLDFIPDEINNKDKIGDIIFEIQECWDKYLKNYEITCYLFQIQSYEYFIYHLNCKNFEVEKSLDKILLNKFTNINFCKNHDENILYNTMKKDCKPELVIKIIENGGKLPRNKNLETMFENNECKIENIKTFLRTYDEKYFSNESLLTILKQNLMRTHKIDIVNIFSSRNLLSNAIKILLESDDSYNILLNLYNSDDVVVNKITINDAIHCINLEKYKELDLILKNNKSFTNDVCDDTTPIMIAIKENKLKCLKLLLHHGADPFYAYNGMSPIMTTIIENRLDMLEFLLENWMKDCSTSDNTSHIMLAIKEGNIEVLKLLLKYGADPFSSIANTTPTLYAIENDKLTSLECLLLYGSEKGMEYNGIANNAHKQITPLMMAISKNKLTAVELLIKYGANPFIYTSGLNALHYAIQQNKYEIVSFIKDYEKTGKILINEPTTETLKRTAIFLAIDTKDPIKFTDLLLHNKNIEFNHIMTNGSNILNYILMSRHKLETKITLFKRYINENIDLTNQVNDTPLIVYAVENNMFDIVVMIMNKLIQRNEISVVGYEKNDNNIIKIISLAGNKKIQIVSKDKSKTNYYPLVVVYLKQGKTEYQDDMSEEEFANYNDINEVTKSSVKNNDNTDNFKDEFNAVLTNTAINAMTTINTDIFKNCDDLPNSVSLNINNDIVKIDKNILLTGMFIIIVTVVLLYKSNTILRSKDLIFKHITYSLEELYLCEDEDELELELRKLVDNVYTKIYFIGDGFESKQKPIYDLIGAVTSESMKSNSEYDYDEHYTSIDAEYTDICFPIA